MDPTSGNGDEPQDSNLDSAANNWDFAPDRSDLYYDSPYDSSYDPSLDVWAVDSEDGHASSSKHPYVEPDPFPQDDSLQVWAMNSDNEANDDVPLDPRMLLLDAEDENEDEDEDEEENFEGTYREPHPHLTGMCPSLLN